MPETGPCPESKRPGEDAASQSIPAVSPALRSYGFSSDLLRYVYWRQEHPPGCITPVTGATPLACHGPVEAAAAPVLHGCWRRAGSTRHGRCRGCGRGGMVLRSRTMLVTVAVAVVVVPLRTRYSGLNTAVAVVVTVPSAVATRPAGTR